VVIMKGRVFSIDVFMILESPTFGPAVSVGRTTPCIRGVQGRQIIPSLTSVSQAHTKP
jgi:hypothetical protein